MLTKIPVAIRTQPDDVTCGPTCLYSVYRCYNQQIKIDNVLSEVAMLDQGGTLAANLGAHALSYNFNAILYTYNLHVFDPTWFSLDNKAFQAKLTAQSQAKTHDRKLLTATHAYLNYLSQGGVVKFEDLTVDLIKKYLLRNIPIIVGLSATYLYKCKREIPINGESDDVKGMPSGHFVVLTGFNLAKNTVIVSDPYGNNPISESQVYEVGMHTLICAILLGVMTYDANLLILYPKGKAYEDDLGP
jgi:hypothetical protein